MAKSINIQDKKTEAIIRTAFEKVGIGVSIISPDMRIIWANKIFKRWFPSLDVNRKPVCYKALYSPSRTTECEYCPTKKAFETGNTQSAETSICSNSSVYSLIATPVKDKSGLVGCVIETVEDITSRKHIEEALQESESQYRITLESLGEAVHVIDKDMRLLMFNKVFQDWNQRLGLETDVIGRKLFEVFPFLTEKVKQEYRKVFNTGKIISTEEKNSVGKKELVTATRKIPVLEQGKVKRVITVIRDISGEAIKDKSLKRLNQELVKSNKRLKQLALRDAHTGLYNYRYLEEIIEAEFFRSKRTGNPFSVIMVDIDYFKSINDLYGHGFGDVVLKQLAAQIKKLLRNYDIVIRSGGEEFIIITPGLDKANALSLAQRLLAALKLYNFGSKKESVKLKLSMAVSSYPEDKIVKGMDLVEYVEKVISKVKENGGDNVFTIRDLGRALTAFSPQKEETGEIKFLKEKIDKLTKGANQSLTEAVLAFAKTIELKDHYTGEHVELTVRYATELAQEMNLPQEEKERIRQAAILHDLGKIGISEKILLKRAKLSKEEFDEIKKHPRIGADIIRPIQFLQAIIPLILYHHERWDGKGYPVGLKGDDIPVGARIIAIADVYQALTSDRPYRKAFSKEEAIKILKEGAGSQFDPAIIDRFLKILEQEP